MRRTFGILTLLALTFSFGEMVWASTCTMPGTDGSTALVAEPASPGSDSGSEAHDCALMAHSGERNENPCPLTPAATQGCTAAASFPAAEAQGLLSPPVTGLTAAAEPIHYTLLLARPLFHPPRAS